MLSQYAAVLPGKRGSLKRHQRPVSAERGGAESDHGMNNGPSARSMAPSIVIQRRPQRPHPPALPVKVASERNSRPFAATADPFLGRSPAGRCGIAARSLLRSRQAHGAVLPAALAGARTSRKAAPFKCLPKAALPQSIRNIASRRRRMSRPTPDRSEPGRNMTAWLQKLEEWTSSQGSQCI